MKVIILLCLVALCFASCRHNCRDHGDCVDDACQCYDGWTGDDCSIAYLALNDGDSLSMDNLDSWAYFYTDVTHSPSSMTYTLVDDFVGDCDIYVRYGDFPTKSHHDQSNTGWDSTSTVTIDHPQNGRWIAGVYNYFSCDFTLSLEIVNGGDCLNDCSGHGICDTFNICHCDDLWGGEDCSIEFVDLSDEEEHSAYVEHWDWNMYYFDSDGTSTFQIVVNQTDASGDSDLYVKFGDVPTLFNYDFRNAAVVTNYALTIGNPEEGRYYIGIYGYNPIGYNIYVVVTRDVECENRCSAHGYCSNDACHCSANFEGSNCESMTRDLIEGESVLGYASDNQWNYYTVTANSANNMVISIDQDWNTGGDCDLYIRNGQQPDRFHYDYRNIGFDDSFSITVQNPLSVHWYIGVYGYRSCQYFISEILDAASCPNDCSGNGNCVNGRCSCTSGHAGQDCNSPLTRIHSGDVLEGDVGQNKWHYYKYSVPFTHTSVSIALIETESTGYLQLYVLEGAPPELTGAEYSDTQQTSLHDIYFRFDGTADVDHDFYIGVYGTANVPIGTTSHYQVFAYSPPI